jgi:GNAT superfamily N-acetyltransferase
VPYLYFLYDGGGTDAAEADLCEEIDFELWRPKGVSLFLPQTPLLSGCLLGLFHFLHIFSNRDYGIAVFRSGPEIVHRSFVVPRYFRFRFMDRDDLQIGNTWTSRDHRGKGLATAAVGSIVDGVYHPGRRLWYVVGDDNHASIAVIRKCGFRLVGKGVRAKRFGTRLLGDYRITEYE